MTKRQKALIHVVDSFSQHIGHTIEFGMERRKRILKAVVLINEVVMLKVDDEIFATEYSEAAKNCSCLEKEK